MPALPDGDIRSIYYGTVGLRSAILRFLKDAADQKVRQMYLYPDEYMEWLSGDPSFFRMWAALIHACVANRTEITIIHHVNRNMKELNDAVAGWLPLYLKTVRENFDQLVIQWEKKQLPLHKILEDCNMSEATFCRR